MTREEAIQELLCLCDEMPSMECRGWKMALEMAIKALEQEDVLDKISAEILALSTEPFHEFDYGYNLGLIGAVKIIDKYKESEEKE